VTFYEARPTELTAWRMAILMGANTRTYKFALGRALLDLALRESDKPSLRELATLYSSNLLNHAPHYPQVSQKADLGPDDFLSLLSQEVDESAAQGGPTERLVAAAMESMPRMVMQKFHNLRGSTELPAKFYEIEGVGTKRFVVLTPAMRSVALNPGSGVLVDEIEARWSLVETAFDAGIGPSLVATGVEVSADGKTLVDKVRRVNIAHLRDSLIGFQYGLCFLCQEAIINLHQDVHVDHMLPFSLMKSGVWSGPDLNGVWNLTVTHAECNLQKSSSIPDPTKMNRLIARNEAIMGSPHVLKKTIALALGATSEERNKFYSFVWDSGFVGKAPGV